MIDTAYLAHLRDLWPHCLPPEAQEWLDLPRVPWPVRHAYLRRQAEERRLAWISELGEQTHG